MAKKRSKPRPPGPKPQQDKPNPFESLYNNKKFNVLGKPAKGQQRKAGKARAEGNEKVY